jgi:ribose transport system ATP-binding protein
MRPEQILSIRGVHKRFPGVHALKGVDFSCSKGEVHALVGHNGAGKTTLIKILGGVYEADEGEIHLRDQPFAPTNPMDATNAGISIIHQDFNLVPDLTVAQNIFLGREPIKGAGFIDTRAMNEGAARILQRLKIFEIDSRDYIRDLSVNQLQLVEIAKALAVHSELIVMDEPTAALTLPDVRKLFAIIGELKEAGVTIIYISHRLEEVFEIGDRVTAMKDGCMLATFTVDGLEKTTLVETMVGRSIVEFFPRHGALDNNVKSALVIKNLMSSIIHKPISFELRTNEIFGLTGLEGCGATELAYSLFGVFRIRHGEILLNGRPVKVRSPREALSLGFGYLTKDRRNEGLILTASVSENMAIPLRVKAGKMGLLNQKQELSAIQQMVSKLQIIAGSLSGEAQYLSGGNQQKVILAKWLLTKCRVLIVDEPTRGVDIESKAEIYKLLRELADQGVIVLVVSSDIEEVIGLCDRIMVLHRGEITADLHWEMASEHAVMLAATGCTLDSEGNVLESNRNIFNVDE